MVGAYGNSWIRTTALDQLASQSFLFDQAFVDSPQLAPLYRAYWLGAHAALEHQPPASAATLPQLLGAAGVHTALLTDEPDVAQLPMVAHFAERALVESPAAAQTADDVSETALARVFAAASQWLASAREPFCLWIHARAMGGPWDAPFTMRQHFADEEDPQPPEFAAVPDYWLPDEFDPDEVLGVKHAYAGQVAALDQCVGAFLDQFDHGSLAGNTQLTLLSARGFPLGEHRRVGPCDEALYNETTQLVWMMRFPDHLGKLARSQALVQPADLGGTLLEWLDLDRARLGDGRAGSLLPLIGSSADSSPDRALMVSLHDRAIRTPAWHLRQPINAAAELYAKPGDRWEVNEVARLLPEIVLGLEAALTDSRRPGVAAPMAEVLTSEVD
jgi:arylsulfatase A-like enzyme